MDESNTDDEDETKTDDVPENINKEELDNFFCTIR